MHGIDDLKVSILRLLKPDPFRFVGQVPNLNCYFIVLIDLDILEDHLSWNDLEALRINSVSSGVILERRTSYLRLHNFYYCKLYYANKFNIYFNADQSLNFTW